MSKSSFSKAEILSALFSDPATDGQWIIVDFNRALNSIVNDQWAAVNRADTEYAEAAEKARQIRDRTCLAAIETSRKAQEALKVAYDTQQARGGAILLERQGS